jgi:hypothetical protein
VNLKIRFTTRCLLMLLASGAGVAQSQQAADPVCAASVHFFGGAA